MGREKLKVFGSDYETRDGTGHPRLHSRGGPGYCPCARPGVAFYPGTCGGLFQTWAPETGIPSWKSSSRSSELPG